MPIDDEEIARVLGGVRADGSGPTDGTPPAPADEWDGLHQVIRRRDPLSRGTIALAVVLVVGPLTLMFLSFRSGAGSLPEAVAGTAFFAGCLALFGVVAWTIAARGKDPGGKPGDGRGETADAIYRVIEYPAFAAAFLAVALIGAGVAGAWRAARRGLGRESDGGKPRPVPGLRDLEE